MTQAELFPQPARVWTPLVARPHQAEEHLTACPRCRRAIDDPEFGCWVVTLGGPRRGMRCDPCWMAEV